MTCDNVPLCIFLDEDDEYPQCVECGDCEKEVDEL